MCIRDRDNPHILSVGKPGIGIVGNGKVYLAGFKQLCTGNGGLVCDLNVDVGIDVYKRQI